MLLANYYVRDGRSRLSSMERTLAREVARLEKNEQEVDYAVLNKHKQVFYDVTCDMMNALAEISTKMSHNDYTRQTIEIAREVRATIDRAHNTLADASLEEMLALVKSVNACFPVVNDTYVGFSQGGADSYESYFTNAVSDSTRTDIDQEIIEAMMRAIQFEERTINFLAVGDRNPANFNPIRTRLGLWGGQVTTHALAVKEVNYQNFKTVGYSRIALGTLRGSTVSNDVFDVLYLDPALSLTKGYELSLYKKEKELIRETIKYLRPGGVLMLTLPSFRFYKDIAEAIAKSYTNVQVRRPSYHPDSGNKLYLLAVRKEKDDKQLDSKIYNMLRLAFQYENIPSLAEKSFESIEMPRGVLPINIFRGSVLNTDELAELTQKSRAMSKFFASQEVSYASEETREPLLPFTTGQLGLVLTSGSLDGVIDEGDGNYHVVKGRVVKTKQVDRDENRENNSVTFTETTANRVQINVITANGEMFQLA